MESTRSGSFIDVSQLPAAQEIKGSKGLGVFLMLFASFWGGLPTLFFISSLLKGQLEPAMFFVLVFTVVGTGMFLAGLGQFFIRGTLRIDRDEVAFDRRTLFGHKQWREPLTRYPGIVSRSEYHSGGKHSSSYTLYIVELHHPDKARRIVLRQSRSEAGLRSAWEQACRSLGLPALQECNGAYTARAVEDLDKPVRELVKEKKLQVKFDPRETPPRGITVEIAGDRLHVTFRDRSVPLAGALVMLGLPGVFIYLGFFVRGVPLAFGLAGLLFGCLFLGAIIWQQIATPQLRLSKEEVHLLRLTPWGETPGLRIHASDIEEVTVRRAEPNARESVVVATDKQKMAIGAGLPRQSLDWLCNCILAVISA